MRHIVLICSCFLVLLLSCDDKSTTENVVEVQDDKQTREIGQNDIEDLRYTEFELSEASEQAVADWQKFQELLKQTDFLKKADLSFFSDDRLLLTTFFQELTVEMPQEIKTNEIMARLVVLETKAQKLNSLLRLDNIPKVERIEGIKEYLIALSNLKLQINKKFEYDKNKLLIEAFEIKNEPK